MEQIVRLIDVHTRPDFNIPFPCDWVSLWDGEVRVVMHIEQLRELAEVLNGVLEDLPGEEAA